MALPTIVRIETRAENSLRRGTGCVVPGGYVLTAARLVAPLGSTEDGGFTVVVWLGSSAVAVRRVAFLDYWTESQAPEANVALLDAAWIGGVPEAFEPVTDWSFVGETKTALARGYGPDGLVWQGEGSLTHLRSERGLEAFQTLHLKPPAEAVGGPLVTPTNAASLVGILTDAPLRDGVAQGGVPLATVTYGALRQKLDLMRARGQAH